MGILHWVDTTGGPLVMLEASKARLWQGIANDDYVEACEVEGFIGRIQKAWGEVCILGDEPLVTGLIRLEGRAALLRWSSADSERQMLDLVRDLPPSPPEYTEVLDCGLGARVLRVFDSSSPPGMVDSSVEFFCPDCTHFRARYFVLGGARAVIVDFLEGDAPGFEPQ